MQERIIAIIQKLPILDEIKQALITKIDIINQRQLIEILSKYGKKIEGLNQKKDQTKIAYERSIYEFEMIQEKQQEEIELERLLESLEKIYN